MLIALLIFAFAVAVVFLLCGIAIGNTGREQLRLELANLKGKHETLSTAYQDLRRIAGEALEVAKRKHFPNKQDETARKLFPDRSAGWAQAIHDLSENAPDPDSVARSMPTYVPPEVKNCPECSVSVRADNWPQECPNCHSIFGFNVVE